MSRNAKTSQGTQLTPKAVFAARDRLATVFESHLGSDKRAQYGPLAETFIGDELVSDKIYEPSEV